MRRWAAGLVLAAMTLGLMAQTGRAAELELAQLQETANNLILALGVVITAIAIMLISILLFKRRTPRKGRA